MSNDVTTIEKHPNTSSKQNISRWFKKNNHGNRLLTLVIFLPPRSIAVYRFRYVAYW
ncbi:hypothetical protein [Marinomonas rhodophyticola]|uniref:Uncharacterized protein n=1 Tax=Marinomonas rhodophyticola TaxID=2992803 RepID=A0ABT3KDF1_9GAMM|nr:hypothetical protein [Marinomonas sp. KJ51-3]MCW4628142.1 hypothetical protein [Marinomonas sp. KJ51-3]